MDFKDWAIKVGIRTLRTFIQAFLGILTASGTGMVEMDVLTSDEVENYSDGEIKKSFDTPFEDEGM